jgi:putative phage-type endonuclease
MIHQGSEAWHLQRVGKVTASRVGAVFTQPRKGCLVSKVRESYLADLLSERITGKEAARDFVGDQAAIEWGAQTEPFARAAYEEKTGNKIEIAGFIDHPTIPMSGASPDGLCSDGGVEIKCPNTKTHLETVRKGVIPTTHIPQMKWNMACTGRRWWDFMSFDPREEEEPYFCRRLEANPNELREMELGVFAFVMELEARLAAYQMENPE